MSKLILANGSEVVIEDGSKRTGIIVVSESKADMLTIWDSLTEENLKTVQIQNEEGVVIGEYADLILVSATSEQLEDGTIKTSFRLREKTEVELLKEEIAAQAQQNEMLTECVLELSEAVYA